MPVTKRAYGQAAFLENIEEVLNALSDHEVFQYYP